MTTANAREDETFGSDHRGARVDAPLDLGLQSTRDRGPGVERDPTREPALPGGVARIGCELRDERSDPSQIDIVHAWKASTSLRVLK